MSADGHGSKVGGTATAPHITQIVVSAPLAAALFEVLDRLDQGLAQKVAGKHPAGMAGHNVEVTRVAAERILVKLHDHHLAVPLRLVIQRSVAASAVCTAVTRWYRLLA